MLMQLSPSFPVVMRPGMGKLKFADGGCYEGNFEADEINGTGTRKFTNGNVFTGSWSSVSTRTSLYCMQPQCVGSILCGVCALVWVHQQAYATKVHASLACWLQVVSKWVRCMGTAP